jgi:hypothetical protein
MKHRQTLGLYGTGLLISILLSACTSLPSNSAEAVDSSSSPAVEMINGGLLVSRSGKPELGLMLLNNSARMLWVSVYFHTPRGSKECVLAKEMEPQAKRFYVCPQSAIQADSNYPIQITVFADLEQTQILDRLNTTFRFSQEDIQAVHNTAKP